MQGSLSTAAVVAAQDSREPQIQTVIPPRPRRLSGTVCTLRVGQSIYGQQACTYKLQGKRNEAPCTIPTQRVLPHSDICANKSRGPFVTGFLYGRHRPWHKSRTLLFVAIQIKCSNSLLSCHQSQILVVSVHVKNYEDSSSDSCSSEGESLKPKKFSSWTIRKTIYKTVIT